MQLKHSRKFRIVLIMALVLLAIFLSRREDEKNEAMDLLKISKIDTREYSAAPDYQIKKTSIQNIEDVRRKSIKIIVAGKLTQPEYEAIAREITHDLKADEYRAAIFWFYLDGDDISDFYTAAKIEWGPQGSWDNAVAGTDYRDYDFTTHVVE